MSSMEAPYPAQLVGWVVWGKVKSLPWWPGQVMHPSKGPPEVRKMAAMKSNAGKLLVMFLGDNKYAFLPWESVVDFAENKERHSSTNYASKYWKLGVEEAEELLARRAGLLPATDHEPVDFATKKTNFTSLAKAWAGGLGSNAKQQNSSGATGGRATERSKTNPLQPETSKIIASSISSPDTKTIAPATKVHHRSSGAGADDGRPKSIGGVMLEWARYMPQVTATRKSAELSSVAETLRFARRLARGEEPVGEVAAANEHALQLLHSFTLQRRLREVDGLVRPGMAATAAASAAAAPGAAMATTLGCSRPGFAPRPPGAGAGDAGNSGGAGGEDPLKDDAAGVTGPLPPAVGSAGQSDAGPMGMVPVVVQEMFTISNVAAVPVPRCVLEALLKGDHDAQGGKVVEAAATAVPPDGPATTSNGGDGSDNQAVLVAAASEAEAEAEAGAPPTLGGVSPTGDALAPLPGAGNAECAKVEGAQGASAAAVEPACGSLVAVAATDGGQQQQQQITSSASQGATMREMAMEVDVALRVNGKLLPHLSLGLMLRRTTSSKRVGGAKQGAGPDAAQKQQQEQQQPVLDPRMTQQEPQAQQPQPQQQQPQLEGVVAATAAISEVSAAAGGNAGSLPPPEAAVESIDDSGDRMETTGAAAGATVLPGDTPLVCQPQEGQQQEELTAVEGASAGGMGVESSVTVSKATATALSTDAPSAAAEAVTPKPTGAAPPGTASPEPRPAVPPPLPPPAREKTANGSGGVPAAAAAAKGDLIETASLDLSRCLAPWLRGEVRVTSWMVCGPRLLLVAVSADRKRDGGLGGIKREARLLLAEAKERRAASPGGPDDDAVDNAGGEQQLKRRLRSATSPPAPAATAQAQAHGSAGGTGRKSSPTPLPSAAAAAAAAQVKQHQQAEGGKEAGGVPQISATGPAAAALMRSRLLQQKRLASAAAEAATAGAGGGGGSGGAASGVQHPGGDASKSASSAAGNGGGGGADARASKKVRLVRFPAPAAGANGAAPCSSSRVSSGGAPAGNAAAAASAAAAAVVGTAGGVAGPGDAGAAPPAGPAAARRRVSYNNQLVPNAADDGMEDGQRFGGRGVGCVTANVGYSCSTYDADWELSYPPWLPQPAQKGAFITVSHLLLNRNHQTHHHHHHHHHHGGPQQRHKADQAYGSHPQTYHQQHGAVYQAAGPRGSAAGPAIPTAVGAQLNHSSFRQPNTNHHHYSHHHHHHHHHHHQHTQHNAHLVVSPRCNGSGAGGGNGPMARTASRRSSGYFLYLDEQEELPYPERQIDGWSSDAGTAMDVEYGMGAVGSAWPAGAVYGAVPAATPGAVPPVLGDAGSVAEYIGGAVTAGSGACEQILLDIRVGDEADAEGPADARPNGGGDAAIAVTVHLPPRDSSTAVHSLVSPPLPRPFTGSGGDARTTSTPVLSRPAQPAAAAAYFNHPGASYLLPPVTPFAEQQSIAPISPAAAAAPTGSFGQVPTAATTVLSTTPFSASAAAAAAAATFGGMPPDDVDLAVTAAILADRNMYVCESAAQNPNDATAVAGSHKSELGGTAAATAGMAADGGGNGDEGPTGALHHPSLCEGEVLRLRQECDSLREQVKLRLAPGALDPLPQQQLPYAELVAQVSERILALALQLPTLSGPTKQAFIQFSRTLMQEAVVCGQAAGAVVATAAGATSSSAPQVSSGRSLAVARVAADLVRSAAAPGLPLHPEDRWAFINLAAELLRP
ncbi:hypothetical protein Vretimale_13229 [Volvox reticuliferus]|uniref:PWWP domain-containing protein n=1 Tax=Volvox reticuliferus TaxID=1737510 RepID=A0A8J4GKX9_9CHLO|nr:hypothetical protein Vretifemale_14130 [Volvox reticuliferus]GIM09316.1 hypothetical protein Vretimale_13229 [Volvox reticuliferus]